MSLTIVNVVKDSLLFSHRFSADMIDDIEVTRKIIERFSTQFIDSLDIDVAIAGAGPAGMVAAKYLADAGKNVVIFERKLSPGGGMWGGGMTFPVIVVQEEPVRVLIPRRFKRLVVSNDFPYSRDAVTLEARQFQCACLFYDATLHFLAGIGFDPLPIRFQAYPIGQFHLFPGHDSPPTLLSKR